MWQPAPPLEVSPSERAILETIVARTDLPLRVRVRARIVLLAAEGKANHEIGQELCMVRARVLRWRQRFAQQGIRGLWDVESIPPQERIPEAVEKAIVFDCLYRDRTSVWIDNDTSLGWTARGMSLRHGVSPASVQRVWKKHGILMRRYRKQDLGVDLRK